MEEAREAKIVTVKSLTFAEVVTLACGSVKFQISYVVRIL
jgi:hypothetical protein